MSINKWKKKTSLERGSIWSIPWLNDFRLNFIVKIEKNVLTNSRKLIIRIYRIIWFCE